MSTVLIHEYLNHLSDLRRVSGTGREMVVREAFKDLLKGWARSHELVFVSEYEITTPARERRYVDGALLHAVRVPHGYWEAKDEKDDLDAEIEIKFQRGYPQDNIIFEDSREAVLIQNRRTIARCSVKDVEKLEELLEKFFAYERKEIIQFNKAIEQFVVDLPAVLAALRTMIENAYSSTPAFRVASKRFLNHAQEAINPSLTDADVREMLIQHILTEEIFSKVFGDDDFHRHNNVAKELYALESAFFVGDLKKRTLRGLDAYYAAIRSAAAQIANHSEKQTFLKVIYENFYKVYNPKAADRLGVVYTPNEIVRFMVESADWLCEKHFRRHLIDKDVDILDPATGTGTFICELMELFRGQPAKLRSKYLEELHANEVAILAYYVANLNIEATYAAITGDYVEFQNLCFVDTLDNVGRHTVRGTLDLFGSVSDENVARIKRQNARRISIVLGNPPYNANQLNENDNNQNRPYPAIDKRIRDTYVADSHGQKTKVYDMYSRFFRWSSDRLADNGIVAFITNRGFIDKRTYDGFRRIVAKEFNDIYVIDLGGDVRDNPKLSGTKHNVFGIQTGVAISFLVRRKNATGCKVHYYRRPEDEIASEKLAFLSRTRLSSLALETIIPDEEAIWINRTENDFDLHLEIANKPTKEAAPRTAETAIFKLYSLGVSTNRDEWVLDFSATNLTKKMSYLVRRYGEIQRAHGEFETDIKWSSTLKRHSEQGRTEPFSKKKIVVANYRPFVRAYFYDSPLFIDRRGSVDEMFQSSDALSRRAITFIGDATEKPFSVLAVDNITDLNFLSAAAAGTKILPLYRSLEDGTLVNNITDWAFQQFCEHYASAPRISKEDIFHYIYAVLHDPIYREKFALNLRRQFPRIPFYNDFHQWCAWGRQLMELHIGYETAPPFALQRDESKRVPSKPKTILKADAAGGTIAIDSLTTLSGIPSEAWEYRLGNRSALEWILDQYKESKSSDPTIQEQFNSHSFADYKEKVIDLLARLTTVSTKTVAIMGAMREVDR